MATEKEPNGAVEPESALALVTALRDTMIARAEGLRSGAAAARTQAVRARALGYLLMRGRSTPRSFWRFIKVKLAIYDERWGSLKGDFRPLIRSHKEDDHEALGDDKRERMLGQGGLGQGWLSWHRRLDQPVGFKFFKPHLYAKEGDRWLATHTSYRRMPACATSPACATCAPLGRKWAPRGAGKWPGRGYGACFGRFSRSLWFVLLRPEPAQTLPKHGLHTP